MNDIDTFISLVRDELGLAVTEESLTRDLSAVVGWDSLNLLSLLVILERATGRPMSLPEMLQAPNLQRIYELAAAR